MEDVLFVELKSILEERIGFNRSKTTLNKKRHKKIQSENWYNQGKKTEA